MTAGRKVNSVNKTWCTPKKYVDAVKDFFGGEIELDPCSNEFSIVNAKTEYMLPDNDGLNDSWNFKTIYVNPPYGADRERGTTIKNWLEKCFLANKYFDSEIIALVPVATNTSHWKKYVFGAADAICFLYDTRLKFLENGVDSVKGAPMACCLIYYGNNVEKFCKHFMQYGASIDITKIKKLSVDC